MKTKAWKFFVISVVALAVSAILLLVFRGSIFSSDALDILWRYNGPLFPKIGKQVLVVGIDNETLRKLRGTKPRLDRRVYAGLIDRLADSGARMIAFDILFDEPGDTEEDKALVGSVKRYGKVISNCFLMFDETFSNLLITGRSFFQKECIREGFSNFPLDSDGFIRRTRLFAPKGELPCRVSLALAAYLAGVGKTPEEVSYHRDYMLIPRVGDLPPQKVSLDHKGRALVPFCHPAAILKVSALDVLEGKVPNDVIRDRVVLIGGFAEEFRDSFHTPFSPKGDMPGVEIHAHILETLFSGQTMREISGPWWWFILFFTALISSFTTAQLGSTRGGVALLLLSVVLHPVNSKLFDMGIFTNLFDIWVILFAGWLSATVIGAIFLRNERNNLALMFRRYISPALIDELMKHPESLELGGARREAVVLFADVRNFTRMCEERPPEDIITFLNEYFSVVTKEIFLQGGVLDKYIGDGLMAFFGLPLAQADSPQRAIKAALKMQEALEELRKLNPTEKFPIETIGIGIHGGDVVVGNVGSEIHQEYTLLGDTVNVASRLESMCAQGQILISQWVKERLPENIFSLESLGKKAIKGRKSEIEVFEVKGPAKV